MRLLPTSLLLAIALSLGGCRKPTPSDPPPPEGTPTPIPSKPPDDTRQVNSTEAVAANNRGEAFRKKGDFENALREYERAIALDPKLANAFNNRGLVRSAKGEREKAQEDFTHAIALDATLGAAYCNRAGLLMRQREYEKAIADYDQATRLNPDLTIAFNNRGWIRATCPIDRLRDGERAVKDGTKACELSGWSDPTALSTLAAGHAECGHFAEAVKWQTKALADETFERAYGERARRALKLYEQGMPYRDGD